MWNLSILSDSHDYRASIIEVSQRQYELVIESYYFSFNHLIIR